MFKESSTDQSTRSFYKKNRQHDQNSIFLNTPSLPKNNQGCIKIKKQNFKFLIAVSLAILCIGISATAVEARRTLSEGTFIIEEGETVEGFGAFGANIIIKGDVKGDLQAFGANIEITGDIDGDLKAYGANIEIDGTVQGDTEAFGANIDIKENADIKGSLKAAGASANIDGTIGEDAEITANTLKLGPNSVIKGDLEYDAKTSKKTKAHR